MNYIDVQKKICMSSHTHTHMHTQDTMLWFQDSSSKEGLVALGQPYCIIRESQCTKV